MKREASLIKNTVIIGFGTMLPKFASLITLPIITERLTKVEYGTYDLISTLVSLCLPIITLQIQAAAFRFLIDKKENVDEIKKIISTMLTFIVITSSVTIVVLYFILFNIEVPTRLLICAYFVADIILCAIQQVCRGIHCNKLYSLSAIIVSLINMIMVLITLQIFDSGLNGTLWALLIATVSAILVIIIKIRLFEYVSIQYFDFEILKSMFSYSWPMIPNSLSNWVMNLSDRVIITGVMGLEANAIYSIANKMPNLFTSIQSTFVMAWQENASIASQDNDKSVYYSSIFDSVSRILFGIMSFLIVSTPVLFPILIKGDYDAAYYQMPILYVAMLFSALASFVGGIYVALKRTSNIGITTIIAACINVLIDLILVFDFGIYAGSVSTLISYGFLAVFRMANIRRFVDIKYNIKLLSCMLCLLSVMGVIAYKRILVYDILNILIGIVSACIINKPIIKQITCVIISHK